MKNEVVGSTDFDDLIIIFMVRVYDESKHHINKASLLSYRTVWLQRYHFAIFKFLLLLLRRYHPYYILEGTKYFHRKELCFRMVTNTFFLPFFEESTSYLHLSLA